jgi:hypothetical protein
MNEHIPGTKLAEQLVTQPSGATMAEIIAATGGPQYNVLKRLVARGYRVSKVKEGKETRYFAEAARVKSRCPKRCGGAWACGRVTRFDLPWKTWTGWSLSVQP